MILKLKLKLLPSKHLQHGPFQDEEISKPRKTPSMPSDNETFIDSVLPIVTPFESLVKTSFV